MKINQIQTAKGIIASVDSETKVITDVQSAMDLLISAKYEAETKYIVIDKNLVCDEFFILSSGIAGEILQKYINYGGKLAIFGDYSQYTSNPLKDFIYESNKGKDFFFVSDKDEAVKKLADNIYITLA